jgi:hypothetical protein
MKSNASMQEAQTGRGRTGMSTWRIFSAFSTLCLILAASVSARAVTTYQDAWLTGEGEETIYIVACGITDGDYDWEYHHTRVETGLRSPAGREAYEISEDTQYPQQTGLYPYARAEAILTFDENDVGDFYLETVHTSSCPYASFEHIDILFRGGTFDQRYTYTGFDELFQEYVYQVTDCVASCTASYPRQRRYEQYRGLYVGCRGASIRWPGGSRTCIGRCGGSEVPTPCF